MASLKDGTRFVIVRGEMGAAVVVFVGVVGGGSRTS